MTVEPIRDLKTIEQFKERLMLRNYRDYMLFLVGINTGLRIGDTLQLKAADVRDTKYIQIKEQKTSKTKKFFINNSLKNELLNYTKEMNDDDYLFKSREKDQNGNDRPISTVQAYRIFKSVADALGLENIGCHSTRKSFGYFYYQRTKDIAQLMEIFNHSSQKVTLRYIGINQEMIDSSLMDFSL